QYRRSTCISNSTHQCFFLTTPRHPRSTLFPYTTLFRSEPMASSGGAGTLPASGRAGGTTIKSWTTPIDAPSRLRADRASVRALRSEEHTSELQSLRHLVCRLLLEKKKDTRLGEAASRDH